MFLKINFYWVLVRTFVFMEALLQPILMNDVKSGSHFVHRYTFMELAKRLCLTAFFLILPKGHA